jgi:hypothetical protein
MTSRGVSSSSIVFLHALDHILLDQLLPEVNLTKIDRIAPARMILPNLCRARECTVHDPP